MSTGDEIKRAMAWGERNAKVLRLAHNWCALLREERFGGVGLIEEEHGLPVGMRGFSCVHAAVASGYGGNLEDVAVGFVRANCVNCSHRQPVAMPSLADILADRERKAVDRARREERAREVAAKAGRERQVARAAARINAPSPDEKIVLDEVATFDGQPEPDVGRLLQLVEVSPSAFSATVRAHLRLVASADRQRAKAALQVLRHLGDCSAETVSLAVAVLAEGSDELAATMVGEHLPLLSADPKSLRACARHLISMAAPSRDHFFGGRSRSPLPAFLLAFYDHHPASVERAFRDLLQDEWKSTRIRAVDAAIPLSIHSRPFFTWVLPEFRRATGLPDDGYNEGPCRGAVAAALAALFPNYPDEVDSFIQVVMAAETGDVPDTLFHAYTAGLTGNRRGEQLPPTGSPFAICLARVLEAATPRSSVDVMREATRALKDLAKKHPSSLADQCERLLGGAVMFSEAKRLGRGPVLDGRPPMLAAMEDNSRKEVCAFCARDLAEAAAALARETPDVVLPIIEQVVKALPAPDHTLAAELVGVLEIAAGNARAQGILVQAAYWALTHPSQVLRRSGQRLYGGLLRAGASSLPTLLHEVAMLGLSDPYVIVHTAAVGALLEGEPPQAQHDRIARSLFLLGECYSRNGGLHEGQARELIWLLLRWEGRLGRIGMETHRLDAMLLDILAQQKWGYDNADLIRQLGAMDDRLSAYGRYWELVAGLAESGFTVEHHADEWLDAIAAAPPVHQAVASDAIWRFVSSAAMIRIDLCDRAVEILTTWGRFAEADRLATWREQQIRADASFKARRTHAHLVTATTSVERQLAAEDLSAALALLPGWQQAQSEALTAMEEYNARNDVREIIRRST